MVRRLRAKSSSQYEVLSVDETDRKILEILRKNGRASVASIGKELSLSKPAVKYRVDRLRSMGIIKGFFALVDSETYGIRLSVIFDLLVEPKKIEYVAKELALMDDVVRVYELSNRPELHVHALFRDQDALERFMKEKLYAIDGIVNINTGTIMKRYKVEVSITV